MWTVLLLAACAAVNPVLSQSSVSLSVDGSTGKASKFEVDIFLEANINRGDDGGLYAELIYNRAFQENGTVDGWKGVNGSSLSITKNSPLSWALPYSIIPTAASKASNFGVYNTGWFNQLPVVAGRIYTGSFWARTDAPVTSITAGLYSTDLSVAYATLDIDTSNLGSVWTEYKVTLKPTRSSSSGANVFAIIVPGINSSGKIQFNLISLFPPTFNNQPNGLRPDLAQALADIKPKYIRWPGGNELEGSTIERRFNWTATVGPLKDRLARQASWVGWATNGLGLMELFDWAESVNIKPLIGIYAGYSLDKGTVPNTTALEPFITDALNELHFMLDPPTLKPWGTLRASYGRSSPYIVDTIEIGNEDFLGNASSSYTYRYNRFTSAITAAFPKNKFEFIATTTVTGVTPQAVDLHNYLTPEQMIPYYNRFDKYSRTSWTVYALEYAVRRDVNTSGHYIYPQLKGSIAEFVYGLGMERNGDIVKGAAYAPLFHNVPLSQRSQWLPDLISFNATVSVRSTSYWVQWLLGNAAIDTILTTTSTVASNPFFWSAGSIGTAGNRSYILKLANTNTTATTTAFKFTGVNASSLTGFAWVLSAPTGRNETADNTIDVPNSVTPQTVKVPITINSGVASGSIVVPAWSAVVLKLTQ